MRTFELLRKGVVLVTRAPPLPSARQNTLCCKSYTMSLSVYMCVCVCALLPPLFAAFSADRCCLEQTSANSILPQQFHDDFRRRCSVCFTLARLCLLRFYYKTPLRTLYSVRTRCYTNAGHKTSGQNRRKKVNTVVVLSACLLK